MIQSMTGFGRGISSSPSKKIIVDLKSLNSKQFDISMRIPSSLREYEIEARNILAKRMERGKVDLSVQTENLSVEASVTFNIPMLKEYRAQCEEMAREVGIPLPADWYSVLMRLPDVMVSEPNAFEEEDKATFFTALEEALVNLQSFRLQEGKKLYDFFCSKIANIGELLDQVEPYEAERVPKIRARLEEQLSRLTSIEYDAGRLEQEMIFYIEKLDVNEEKLRLRSHLNYFLATLDADCSKDGGQGKKLGFIAQEMGREINTLGSKANHAEIQKIVVKMKDELEQIKEQVLNVL